MAYTNVNVNVLSSRDDAPLEGVLVRILNATTLHTMATLSTNSSGVAAFVLPSNRTYEVRLFLEGALQVSPRSLPVGTEEAIEVTAKIQPPDVHDSTDPALCNAYGYLLGPHGRPVAGQVDVHAEPSTTAFSYAGKYQLMHSGWRSYQTDGNYPLVIPLRRCGVYDIRVHALEEQIIRVQVPGLPSVALTDLLWPYLSELLFTPAYDETPLAVGEVRNYLLAAKLSSGLDASLELFGLSFASSNTAVLEVSFSGGYLSFRGVAVGTATVSVAEDTGRFIVRKPEPGIAPFPLSVEVA